MPSQGIVHHAVTAQDILNAGGTLVLEMHGSDDITLQLGFAVLVTFDAGDPLAVNSETTRVGAGGESIYSPYPLGVYRVQRGPTRLVRLQMPPGEGAVEAQAYCRPQLVVVDGVRSGVVQEPIGANLWSLPLKSARIISTNWPNPNTSHSFNVTLPSQFEIAANGTTPRSPSELWIVSASAVRLDAATGLPSGILYGVDIMSESPPAGNQEKLLSWWGNGLSAFAPCPLGAPAHLVLKAALDDWPGPVAGGVQIDLLGSATGQPDVVHIFLNYYYRT